jgi:acid stress-induced BolA-like protein IbaG/YrbA
MEQIDRQQAVYDALHEGLGPDASQVSIILTYTPDEFELMKAA